MKLALAIVGCIALTVSQSARAAPESNSSEIAAETGRTLQEGKTRVANFWWLPQEYWEDAARELDLPAADQEKIGKIFRDYLFIAALDTTISEQKKPEFASIADIVKRSRFTRNGAVVEPLREVNPDVAKLVPTLVYLLRASLGGLGEGLRLMPLSNVDAQGKSLVTGTGTGEVHVEFQFASDAPTHEISWHAPLTALVGTHKCPKGGEELEASWNYCPWHGVKVEGGAKAPAPAGH
jgi:hypothetical protein